MNKVITINLNGRAYQVEEKGYETLTQYLNSARAGLADDPDRDEVMLDFEQAIADKCDAKLNSRKNVVTSEEVEEIIKAMGPVEGTARKTSGMQNDASASGTAETVGKGTANSPKRLYRISAGEWIFGVCTGLAAYFNMDVTLMRLIFVVLGVLTHGAWLVVYIILIFVMPVARTEDDLAAARGEPPLTASDILNHARDQYHNEIKGRIEEWRKAWQEGDNWHKKWKEEERARRKEEHRMRREENRYGRNAGLTVFGGIMLAALTAVWIFSIWTFLAYGTLFHFAVITHQPIWLTLVWITLAYLLISWPFKAMMRGYHGGPFGFIMAIIFIGVAFYVANLFFPDVHTWWHALTAYLQMRR